MNTTSNKHCTEFNRYKAHISAYRHSQGKMSAPTMILAGGTWTFMCIVQDCVIFVRYSTAIAKVLAVLWLWSATQCTRVTRHMSVQRLAKSINITHTQPLLREAVDCVVC